MKIPARCNKRQCQARRSLSKPLEAYARRPKCHIAGCSGLMLIDKTRADKANDAKDRGVPCHCNAPVMLRPTAHRRGQKGCMYRDEMLAKRGKQATHSPIEPKDYVPF